ncbi:transcription termination factor MTERF2, chloroplastic-like [Oryza brachyantha]|uniref:Uncharacterized protein n=1 Tax=Oryza brachyantha TaxID=4533 RepID=J3LH39_ORYBR|nr:transcription termination factor MTERF2, chloroplastic-like [Oryza brachyantha]
MVDVQFSFREESGSSDFAFPSPPGQPPPPAAMLHLQKQLLRLRGSITPALLSLHRVLFSTAVAVDAASRGQFSAVDYLVNNCGLTPEQAVKAARYISHWKSPSKGDAVLAFLAGPDLGLSKADISHVLVSDPRVLNCRIDRTLKPRLDGFRAHGLSGAQIRSLLLSSPCSFRSCNIHEILGFWIPFLGSTEELIRHAKRSDYLLKANINKVVKPNIALLRECGLSDYEIARMCVPNSRLLTSNPERLKVILARADKLGVPRHCLMFKQAVTTAMALHTETMASKLKSLGEIMGWSPDEVAKVVRINPVLLRYSEERLRRVSKFLMMVAGLNSKYILSKPTVLMYSLERRLVPRYYVMKVLQEKGLPRPKSFYTLLPIKDELFRLRYIQPHKGVLPGLADAYTAACNGELPEARYE